jgi:hypothetical protein
MSGTDVVISLYDLSGKLVEPWAEAGYEAYRVDMEHPRAGVDRWGKGETKLMPLRCVRPESLSALVSACRQTLVEGF